MNIDHAITRFVFVLGTAVLCFGCAEAKLGIGPFKAASVEVGPGGVEAKGPSAGPFKAVSGEVGLGGAEAKEPSVGPLKMAPEKLKSRPQKEK